MQASANVIVPPQKKRGTICGSSSSATTFPKASWPSSRASVLSGTAD